MVGLLMVSTGAYADFIYDVDRTIGDGSVVGTITTDETTGALSVDNNHRLEPYLGESLYRVRSYPPKRGWVICF